MQNIRCSPEAPMRSESTPPRVPRCHWAGLVRLLGAVILVVALAAAIVGMLAIRFGQLPIGGADGNAGPAAMSSGLQKP